MKSEIRITKGRFIGKGHPCLVIAEISANHGQDFNSAVRLIRKAKSCGADAVKFQAYTPDTLTIDSDRKHFRIRHPRWGRQTLYQLYKKAYTPRPWFRKLKKAADDAGIMFFATAFDKSSVDMLEELDVPLHKIASFELVDLPLIEYAAKTKKPLIMSVGMAARNEIKEALDAARGAGARDIVLLKCVSDYPAAPEEINLNTMADMRDRFRCLTGLSDHSLGINVSLAAASLGASVIEKHFIMSRKIKTPDSFFSIEPEELRTLASGVKEIGKALGKVHYGLTEGERKSRVFRRSLFVVKDMKKGELFTEGNVRSIRPAHGMHPRELGAVLGRTAARDIKKGTPLASRLFG
ncbi:MAG: pseudaminic acid synthase [Candidatus Omnitrophota bacterium]